MSKPTLNQNKLNSIRFANTRRKILLQALTTDNAEDPEFIANRNLEKQEFEALAESFPNNQFDYLTKRYHIDTENMTLNDVRLLIIGIVACAQEKDTPPKTESKFLESLYDALEISNADRKDRSALLKRLSQKFLSYNKEQELKENENHVLNQAKDTQIDRTLGSTRRKAIKYLSKLEEYGPKAGAAAGALAGAAVSAGAGATVGAAAGSIAGAIVGAGIGKIASITEYLADKTDALHNFNNDLKAAITFANTPKWNKQTEFNDILLDFISDNSELLDELDNFVSIEDHDKKSKLNLKKEPHEVLNKILEITKDNKNIKQTTSFENLKKFTHAQYLSSKEYLGHKLAYLDLAKNSLIPVIEKDGSTVYYKSKPLMNQDGVVVTALVPADTTRTDLSVKVLFRGTWDTDSVSIDTEQYGAGYKTYRKHEANILNKLNQELINLKDEIKYHNPNANISIDANGHSLGGALTQNFANSLVKMKLMPLYKKYKNNPDELKTKIKAAVIEQIKYERKVNYESYDDNKKDLNILAEERTNYLLKSLKKAQQKTLPVPEQVLIQLKNKKHKLDIDETTAENIKLYVAEYLKDNKDNDINLPDNIKKKINTFMEDENLVQLNLDENELEQINDLSFTALNGATCAFKVRDNFADGLALIKKEDNKFAVDATNIMVRGDIVPQTGQTSIMRGIPHENLKATAFKIDTGLEQKGVRGAIGLGIVWIFSKLESKLEGKAKPLGYVAKGLCFLAKKLLNVPKETPTEVILSSHTDFHFDKKIQDTSFDSFSNINDEKAKEHNDEVGKKNPVIAWFEKNKTYQKFKKLLRGPRKLFSKFKKFFKGKTSSFEDNLEPVSDNISSKLKEQSKSENSPEENETNAKNSYTQRLASAVKGTTKGRHEIRSAIDNANATLKAISKLPADSKLKERLTSLQQSYSENKSWNFIAATTNLSTFRLIPEEIKDQTKKEDNTIHAEYNEKSNDFSFKIFSVSPEDKTIEKMLLEANKQGKVFLSGKNPNLIDKAIKLSNSLKEISKFTVSDSAKKLLEQNPEKFKESLDIIQKIENKQQYKS